MFSQIAAPAQSAPLAGPLQRQIGAIGVKGVKECLRLSQRVCLALITGTGCRVRLFRLAHRQPQARQEEFALRWVPQVAQGL